MADRVGLARRASVADEVMEILLAALNEIDPLVFLAAQNVVRSFASAFTCRKAFALRDHGAASGSLRRAKRKARSRSSGTMG